MHSVPKFRCNYDYRPGPVVLSGGPSLTKQSEKAQCDINNIMKRYTETGICEHMSTAQAFYDDVSQVGDYHEALNRVNAAYEAFMEYPAELRKRFDNDPQKLINFLGVESNREEAIKLGLVEKKHAVPSGVVAPTSTGGSGSGAAVDSGAPKSS